MTLDPRTPVLIGTGQVVQRAEGIDGALDAVAMMVQAIELAAKDAGLGSVPNPDSIRVVNLLSWKYGNPAQFIAEDLHLTPRELVATPLRPWSMPPLARFLRASLTSSS